jgi:hypothetical protein
MPGNVYTPVFPEDTDVISTYVDENGMENNEILGKILTVENLLAGLKKETEAWKILLEDNENQKKIAKKPQQKRLQTDS